MSSSSQALVAPTTNFVQELLIKLFARRGVGITAAVVLACAAYWSARRATRTSRPTLRAATPQESAGSYDYIIIGGGR
mgnify:CR=1 FL=1